MSRAVCGDCLLSISAALVVQGRREVTGELAACNTLDMQQAANQKAWQRAASSANTCAHECQARITSTSGIVFRVGWRQSCSGVLQELHAVDAIAAR